MSSQVFFYVNLGLGIFLVLIFLIGKKGIVAPSKLNLRRGLGGKGLTPAGRPSPASSHSHTQDERYPEEISLNVLFMYNGHNFDAYEVLGVPAGANFQIVERFYQEALKKKGEDREFLEAAFFAIKSSRKN